MAPLDQPRLASLPTRGRVHRPGLPRRRVPGHEPPATSSRTRAPGDEFPETSSRRQCQRKLLPRHGLSRSSSTEDGFSGNPSSESGSSESGPSGAVMALIEIPQSCSSEFLRSRGQVSAGSCRS
ncbi:hypothetical protein ACFPRL_02600 [Pseudoclavibacter helvolus]